jgi:hypothetical protein
VLRFWQEHDPPDTWRFSLEDVQTGERRGFANLDALVAFLRAAIAREAASNDDAT